MMNFSIRRFGALALCIAAATGAAMGQRAPQQAPVPSASGAPTQLQERQGPPPGATVLHTGTQLVIVDVTVRDKKGNPVNGLKREDFTIFEAKQPQTLRAFDEFATSATPPVVPPEPKLPAGSFTNYIQVPARGPLNILLIDGLNTPLADQGYLHLQLAQYVKSLKPGTRLAVFGMAGHLYMLQGFTSDPAVLQATLAREKNGQVTPLLPNSSTDANAMADALSHPGPGMPGDTTVTSGDSGSALNTGNVSNFFSEMSQLQTRNRSEQTIEAFDTLGRWLMNFPGRKNVIWFSAAFPLGVDPNANFGDNTNIPSEDSTIFQLMLNRLTQAQVSVYPVDPRGLQVNSAFQASDVRPNQIGNFAGNSRSFNANKDAEHASMQAFASDTGGVPYYNGNDLGKAIDSAINDGANYYTLAYTPSEHKTGGEWRTIQIALNGDLAKAGYTLSYRRGYYAENTKVPSYRTGTGTVSTANFSPGQERRDYARDAMTRGAPMPTDILFTARVLPHSTRPDDTLAQGNVLDPEAPLPPPYRRFDVDVAAVPKYFTLTKQANGNYTGAIELAVFVYSPDGKLINTAAKKLTLNLTQDAYEKFEKNVVGVHLEVSAPAETDSVLRIGFQDVTSNKIGALEVATSSVKNLQPQN
jgi:VWFA-related protein